MTKTIWSILAQSERVVSKITLLKLGVEGQCSNFLHCIKTLVNTMQEPENLLILEKFSAFNIKF